MSEVDYNRLHKRKDQAGTSYIIPSGSDSEELKPLTKKRKRARVVLDSSSDSDSSLPRTKVVATSSTIQLLSEIRSLLGDYHCEVVRLRLERELDARKATVYASFSCLICKEIVNEESAPVVPPCCRASVVCFECMIRWLENQPSCPHCREPLEIENCSKLPILRPLFDFLEEYGK